MMHRIAQRIKHSNQWVLPASLILIAFCGFVLGRATAAETKNVKKGLKKPDVHSFYLYEKDHRSDRPLKVTTAKSLLANRVYLAYDEDLHTWVFQKTDYDKKFSFPPEYLRPGSVAPGSVIGAKLALQRFLLQPEGNWTPTLLREQYKIWIKGEPPVLKILTYRFPDMNSEIRVPTGTRDSSPKPQIK